MEARSIDIYKNYIDIIIYHPKFWQKKVPSPAVVQLRGWTPGPLFEYSWSTLWVLFCFAFFFSFSQPQYFLVKSDLSYPKPTLSLPPHNLNAPQIYHSP